LDTTNRQPTTENRKPKTVAIIPARYASTRLPGKPLVDIGGVPMILRVVARARQVLAIDRVIVATDDQRVLDTVTAAGEEALMTSDEHRTGTDRLAEVAAKLDAEIIVNVQGDEPLIEPATIESALSPLLEDSSVVMSTTCEPIESAEDLINPNVVKVVTDREGFAIYFSRSPIPFPRSEVLKYGSLQEALRANPELLRFYAKHTGLYVYRREFLLAFTRLAPTKLEEIEALEQLRAIENGYKIKVIRVKDRSIGVDTPEDLERVRKLIIDN
jgi:3-deoxy-manno-octulosonate cytidylyltransferase (CMP-KDO synthetase)